MNLKQLWSIIRGRRTNFSWMNASWGDYGGLVRYRTRALHIIGFILHTMIHKQSILHTTIHACCILLDPYYILRNRVCAYYILRDIAGAWSIFSDHNHIILPSYPYPYPRPKRYSTIQENSPYYWAIFKLLPSIDD